MKGVLKSRIDYTEFVHLKRGDKIRVRGYVRTVLYFRGFRVAYSIKDDTSSCHWTEIQEVIEKTERGN